MTKYQKGIVYVDSLRTSPKIKEPGYIGHVIDVDLLDSNIKDKFVSATPHEDPNVPYVILNYTPRAAYAQEWNDATIHSRGLIFDKNTGEIIARGFPKFFNYGQLDRDEIKALEGPVTVTDKMDGSLGILYKLPNGEYAISTRGSMNSDQAVRATEIYRNKYSAHQPEEGKTYLFEIIYPENRIVLDYGDKEDIVLLGVQNNVTGLTEDLSDSSNKWPGETTEILPYSSFDEALKAPIPENKEGLVLYFHDSGQRVKLKGDTYLALHKAKFGLNRNKIIDAINTLNDKESLDSWVASLPDEVYTDVKKFIKEYNHTKKEIVLKATEDVKSIEAKNLTVAEQHKAISSLEFNTLAQIIWASRMNNKDHSYTKNMINSFFVKQFKSGKGLTHKLPPFETKNIVGNKEDA